MSDNERGELSERVAVLEALLKAHEAGALIRKAEITKTLDAILLKQGEQQCSVHSLNMINLRSEITQIKEKDLVGVNSRLTFLEKCFWMGLGGLAVLEVVLKFVVK